MSASARCVVVSAVGCSESGHRDSDNPFARKLQLVESFYADKQCQCGIESAGYADNHLLRPDMYQPLRQPRYLNGENLPATIVQFGSLGHERVRVDLPSQYQFLAVYEFGRN